ncbi:hypothetical protein BDC45DRAFT_533547 [Circinella umbellata]|nr:hypothetical protein BDC45DRAFT_533547 [Circinella umbellata]
MKIALVTKSLFLLLLIFGPLVHALTPQPRADPMCGYMSTEAKIYCYGGQRFADGGGATSSFDQYFFSMSLTQDWQVTDMQNGWEHITEDVGENTNFAMEVIPNQNIIFMHGGAISALALTRYKAAYINTTDINVGWKEISPAQRGSRVQTQSAILGPDNSTIYIWGGMRNTWTGDMENGDEIRPRQMYTFNVANWQWGTGTLAAAGYTYAKPVLVGTSIYYLGGYTTASNKVSENPMDSVLLYNTDTGAWQTQGIGGSITPSTRIRHTVNLKPSTGEVILFGGQNPVNNSQTRDDYFYILSTQDGNLQWSTRTLGGTSSNLGVLGHSAVVAGDYLFVMFGAVNNDNPAAAYFSLSSEVRVMDINKWSWVTSVSALTPEARSTTANNGRDSKDGGSQENNTGDTNHSAVSTGTIAGIVVGGVADSLRNGSTSKDQHTPFIIQGQPPVFHRTEKPDGLLSVNSDRDPQYSLPPATETDYWCKFYFLKCNMDMSLKF